MYACCKSVIHVEQSHRSLAFHMGLAARYTTLKEGFRLVRDGNFQIFARKDPQRSKWGCLCVYSWLCNDDSYTETSNSGEIGYWGCQVTLRTLPNTQHKEFLSQIPKSWAACCPQLPWRFWHSDDFPKVNSARVLILVLFHKNWCIANVLIRPTNSMVFSHASILFRPFALLYINVQNLPVKDDWIIHIRNFVSISIITDWRTTWYSAPPPM